MAARRGRTRAGAHRPIAIRAIALRPVALRPVTLRPGTRLVALPALVAVLAACGAGQERGGGRAGSGAPASAATARSTADTGSGSAWLADTAWATANDAWNVAEVKRRLGEAGFVVSDSGRTAAHPPLSVPGRALGVGNGVLELYVYPSSAARERDARGLDTAAASGALPTPERPRWIVVNNLIALLRTPSDRLAERVGNVLRARHLGR